MKELPKNYVIKYNIDGLELNKESDFKNILQEDSDILVRIVTDDGGIIVVDITLFGDTKIEPVISIDIMEDSSEAISISEVLHEAPEKDMALLLYQGFIK